MSLFELERAVLKGLPVGVIADVHGNSFALRAVLDELALRRVTCVVHLGDCVWGPLDATGTLELFRSHGILSIAGNQDREELGALSADNRDYLSKLPPYLCIEGHLLLCHGTPSSDTSYLLEEVTERGVCPRPLADVQRLLGGVTEPIVLCGHTHIPRRVGLPSGQVVANPGSVGLPAYSDDVPWPHAMESGSPDARFGVLLNGALELCSVLYDFELAAEMAERNGRPDWAHQLRTGCVPRR